MEIGKLPNDMLEKLILGSIEKRREETVVKPDIGEDCCVLDLGGSLCVVSTDPITAASENAGVLSVVISLNDLASSGAEPVGILTTALLPPYMDEEGIRGIFKSINDKCRELGIDILGGHTEITDTVNKPVLVTTAIGRVERGELVTSSGAQPGDFIYVTKAAGIEGTAIIAADMKETIKQVLSEEEIKKARGFIEEISVLRDGLTAARHGASAMHDVTEGGVSGALWEICRASGRGAAIDSGLIPVRHETMKICRHLGLDPHRLISSGCMMFTCKPEKADEITQAMKEQDIPCTKIGVMTEGSEIIDTVGGKREVVRQPGPDEIYKVFKP